MLLWGAKESKPMKHSSERLELTQERTSIKREGVAMQKVPI